MVADQLIVDVYAIITEGVSGACALAVFEELRVARDLKPTAEVLELRRNL